MIKIRRSKLPVDRGFPRAILRSKRATRYLGGTVSIVWLVNLYVKRENIYPWSWSSRQDSYLLPILPFLKVSLTLLGFPSPKHARWLHRPSRITASSLPRSYGAEQDFSFKCSSCDEFGTKQPSVCTVCCTKTARKLDTTSLCLVRG